MFNNTTTWNSLNSLIIEIEDSISKKLLYDNFFPDNCFQHDESLSV